MRTRQSAATLQAFHKFRSAQAPLLEAPPSPADATNNLHDDGQYGPKRQSDVEAAIRSTFNFRHVLEDRVAVDEKAGEVTLSGSVQDRYEYWLAEYTAAHCAGVKRVENRLVVEPLHGEGTDRWIEFSVVRALLTRADVVRGSVSAVACGGAVTLRGWVKNLARKGQVEACASEVAGVRSVSNDIRIGEGKSGYSEKRDDASIVGQVRAALRGNPLTRSFEGEVTSSDGFVAVVGEATSEAERNQIAALALGVSGVKSLANGLTVKG